MTENHCYQLRKVRIRKIGPMVQKRRSFYSVMIMCFALVLAFLPGEGHTASQVRASHVEVSGTDSNARFVLEMSKEVGFNVFALADPYRVVIDLPEIDFNQLDGGSDAGKGLIKAFRAGLFSPGKSRIVLDVASPVAITEHFILPATGNQPARLELGLKKATRDEFMRDFALNGGRPAAPLPTRNNKPPASIADLIAPREETGRPVIVIDPGHGGVDPGTRGAGKVLEKNIVLNFGKKLRDRLVAAGHYDVMMTRDTDTFVPLRERREFARQHQADLFISVHADSVKQSGVRGATVYTLSDDASDEVAAALAHKENKADLIAGIALEDVSTEVSDILLDLAQRETNNFSIVFANTLVSSLKNKVKLNRNPKRSASFVVLKAHDVPSVLVELGYLSNVSDSKSLNSGDWQKKATIAVSKAVNNYFRTRIANNQ